MTDTRSLARIVVMGAGAVGCFYGGMLARAGLPVTLIARPAHAQAMAANGLRFDGQQFQESIPVSVGTGPESASDAALLLLCVKTRDTSATCASLAPYLPPAATVLVMQNGVDNVRRVQAELDNPVFPAVVYVAASMAGPGHLRHAGGGSLLIGQSAQNDSRPVADAKARLEAISATMESAGIPCPVSANIDGDLWSKLLINCSFNAVSALGRSQYKRMAASPDMMAVMNQAAREVVAVGTACGVTLSETDPLKIVARAGQAMGEATSSTEQDIRLGRPTEIDELNGYIVRRGAEHGIPTPVNQTLHALVKLLEASPGANDTRS